MAYKYYKPPCRPIVQHISGHLFDLAQTIIIMSLPNSISRTSLQNYSIVTYK